MTDFADDIDAEGFAREWDEWTEGGEEEKCTTCKGTGMISALTVTLRQGPFIASYGECPDCDGSGEAP